MEWVYFILKILSNDLYADGGLGFLASVNDFFHIFQHRDNSASGADQAQVGGLEGARVAMKPGEVLGRLVDVGIALGIIAAGGLDDRFLVVLVEGLGEHQFQAVLVQLPVGNIEKDRRNAIVGIGSEA